MSGSLPSPWLSQNELYYPQFANQQLAANQLAQQQTQQQIGTQELDMMSRAAAGLLNEQAYPDEASRAAAYPAALADLQRLGFARNAPSVYPGKEALQRVVAMGMTVPQQYQYGVMQPPGLSAALSGIHFGGQPQPGGSFGQQLGQAESGGNPQAVNAGGYAGTYQFGKQRLADLGLYKPAQGEDMADNKTWSGTVSIPPYNVSTRDDFLKSPGAQQAAFNAHLANIDQAIADTPGAARFDPNGLRAVAHLGGVQGMQKFVASGGAYNPADANGTRLSDYYRRFAGGGAQTVAATQPTTQQASAAPQSAPQGDATPPPTQFAGPGAPPPPAQAQAQPQPIQLAPPQPQPGPARTAPVATGVNSPQYQQASAEMEKAVQLRAAYPMSPAAKAWADALETHAKLLLQTDSVIIDPNTGIQTHTLTGAQEGAATPLSHWVFDPKQGAWIDTTGAKAPVTPPSPRIVNVPGIGAVQSKPGGGADIVVPMSPQGLAAQSEAETLGGETGRRAAVSADKMYELGREADAAIGNIDYGISQLREAAAGGLPSGKYAGVTAGIAAGAKYLGVDTNYFGINPEAIGSVQAAQKTLAVLGGRIIQQAIGEDSQITEGKVTAFIHAHPGLENDPQAIEKILSWARSQYVYNREMAIDAMQHVNAGGILDPGWRADYIRRKGAFAPIYDPLTREMAQPAGEGPSPRMPAEQQAPPPARVIQYDKNGRRISP